MPISFWSKLGLAGRATLVVALAIVLGGAAGLLTRSWWVPPLKARILAWAQAGEQEKEDC
jgi:hypothetical protein